MHQVVVIISARSEWRETLAWYSPPRCTRTPYGEAFLTRIGDQVVHFLHGGVGKIAAAGSAQYAVDHWRPALLTNLGTCGGFHGQIARGQVMLVERTLVYDIHEQMSDPQEAIQRYAVDLDLSWLQSPYPQAVRRGLMLSADRDIHPGEVAGLHERYGAVAADWESGAIAWVAAHNHVRCLILRGVSDLVAADSQPGETMLAEFYSGTRLVMPALLEALPAWLACAGYA